MAPIAKRRKRFDDVGARKRMAYPVGYRSRRGVRVYGPYIRLGTPLGTKQYANFRYHDQITLAPATGSSAVHVFSANGMYDPDITATGHQPRGFDQVMALYDHYVVLGAKITCIFGSGGTSGASVCGIRVADNATVSASNDYNMEAGNCVVGANPVSTGGDPLRLTMQVNPNKFLGRSNPLSDPELKGTTSANPTEQCYFHVFAFMNNAAGTPVNEYVSVILEYSAMLIEPKTPPVS